MERYKVVIEIPKGNVNNKYEYDEESKIFNLDFVFENVVWPFNYGFFPKTLGGDGDTLDAMVLSSAPIKQGSEMDVKIIGAIDVLDRGEEDLKIICAPINDAGFATINDIIDVSEKQKKDWSEFFLELARQKKKDTVIRGLKNRSETIALFKQAVVQ